MLGDNAIRTLAIRLSDYRRNKRRLLRLQAIRRVDSQMYDNLLDTEDYLHEMPLDARILGSAVMSVSNSPVWQMISTYLRDVRLKKRPPFRTVRRAVVKLRAKLRKNFLTQYDVKYALRTDAESMQNMLRWA